MLFIHREIVESTEYGLFYHFMEKLLGHVLLRINHVIDDFMTLVDRSITPTQDRAGTSDNSDKCDTIRRF